MARFVPNGGMKIQNTNLIGILSAVGASTLFTINDTTIKFLSGGYALHQIVLIRSILALAVTLAILMPLMGGYKHLRTRRLPAHLLRGLFVVFANVAFFLGLSVMPIADATAIFFVAPLIITVFSVVFLKEHVGARRWSAVGVGFVGVLIIMRPGSSSFQLVALFPLAAAFGYAGLHILTRRIGATESAVTMSFYIQLTFIAVALIFGLALGNGHMSGKGPESLDFLTRAWGRPQTSDYMFFLIIGTASAIGGYLISQAYRLCEAGLAAPFEYIAMPLSVLWGVLIFGEWPDHITWIGIALIMGSGLYMAWREGVQHSYITTKRPKR